MKKYFMALLGGIIISGVISGAGLWKSIDNFEAGMIAILSSMVAIIFFQCTKNIESDFYITFWYGLGVMVVPILINFF